MSEAPRVLVTGGTGFLGRELVRQILAERSWQVRVLARDPERVPFRDHPRVEAVRGDLRDAESVARACAGVEVVFHAANRMAGTWEEYQEDTVRGTERVIAACLASGVRRLVYVSSIWAAEAFGESRVVDEESPYRTSHLNAYSRAKIDAERAVRRAVAEEGLDAVIVRPGILYGPGGGHELEVGYRVGARLLVVRARDEPIPTLFIEHAADGLIVTAERGARGEIYQLVDDEPVSKLDYLALLRKRDPGRRVLRVPDWAIHAASGLVRTGARGWPRLRPLAERVQQAVDRLHAKGPVRYCNERIKALGWRPRTAARDALARMMAGPGARPAPEESGNDWVPTPACLP